MIYTREELDWIEAEWAMHSHGRQAFLSQADFAQLMAWQTQGIPAELLVSTLEVWFERNHKRPNPARNPRLQWLDAEVQRGLKLTRAISESFAEAPASEVDVEWSSVTHPLKTNLQAKGAYAHWRRLKASEPSPEDPGFLAHFDATRAALDQFLDHAAQALGPRVVKLEAEIQNRLRTSGVLSGGIVWTRALAHQRTEGILRAVGL